MKDHGAGVEKSCQALEIRDKGMIRRFACATFCAISMTSGALAATLPGTSDFLNGGFLVDIYQSVNDTNATTAAASAANVDSLDSSKFLGTFVYEGDLNFSTTNGSNTTIGDWLNTGSNPGSVTWLDPNNQTDIDTVLSRTLSNGSLGNGDATSTYFDFQAILSAGNPFTASVANDDGLSVYQNGVAIFSDPDPQTTGDDPTTFDFSGSASDSVLRIIYVATNSDPSTLQIAGTTDRTLTPVPLPAGFPLLVAGLGCIALMKRRKKAA
jgi:hypothetical protein